MNPLSRALRAPGTVYLLGASLVGRLPSAMASLAIVQLVRLGGGDFALAGAITAIYIVAGAVGQPLLGRIVDRRGQTAVIVVAAVVSCGSFVALAAFGAGVPALGMLCAAAAGFFTPPLEPSLRSLWPRIVGGGPDLKAAFSLDAGAQEILFIVGPLLTVLGIAAFGAGGNVVFAGVLGLVGSLVFAAHRLSRTARTAADRDAAASGGSPLRERGFVRVLIFTFGVGVPVGSLTIVATVGEERHALPGLAGWMLAANALGALIGAAVIALRPPKRSPHALLPLFGLLLAVVYLPLLLTDAPGWFLLLAAVVSGLMLPPTLSQIFDYVHQAVREAHLTEANSWVVSAMTVGVAAGTLGLGAIADTGGGWAVPLGLGAAILLTVIAALIARTIPAPPHAPTSLAGRA
jgi:MFS family permease